MSDVSSKELFAGYTTFTTAGELAAGGDAAPGIDAPFTPASTSLIPWPTPSVDSTIAAGC